MRIAHIVPHAFLPPDDGGRLRTATLAAALATRGELHILSLDDDHRRRAEQPPVTELQLPLGGRAYYHSHLGTSGKRVLAWSLPGFLEARRVAPLPFAWCPPTARHGALWRSLGELRPDLIIADNTQLAPFAAFGPAPRRIVSTHNLESAVHRQFAELEPARRAHLLRLARRYERAERALLSRVDQVWAVSPEEVAAYGAMGIRAGALRVVPNVVPDRCFLPPAPGTPGTALFFGSLWYPPNQDAVEALCGLAERLRASGRALRVQVAGRGATPGLEARMAAAGVEHLGFVEDLAACIAGAAVVVVPLRKGAGTKLKTVEAMAAGKPILTTAIGAEGLGLVDGEHAAILELGEAFAARMADMASRPGAFAAMGAAAQRLARERYSLQALVTAVGSALDALPA